ncbi:unnamed protein product [Caenorhabditis bovis]|uniref:Major facilitator superfamily (MFS) profile domain-containing protein n=1 Tax=Caenorhabditis bovis TaxID=2654633 RepID=A0A8S1EY20_9PELO|nr:unnamed protein product [Caenorhabditis bovis]
MAEKLSADDVLNTVGRKNQKIISCILLCGITWTPIAFTAFCPSFVLKSPDNSSFVAISDEFDVTGDSKWLADSTTTFYMIGNMIGGIFIPPLADKYGRLPIFVVTLLLMSAAGCASAFSLSLLSFCILRLIHGVFYTAAGLAGWVLCYENTPVGLRFFTSVYFGITWVVGACLLALLAYILPNWRILMFTISIPNVVIAAIIYFFVPESIHYLASIHDSANVKKWLDYVMGPQNNIEASDIVEEQHDGKTSTFVGLMRDSWKHKIFLLYILSMAYIWIVDTFIYFGLSFYSTDLAGDVYTNFVLMSLVEAPAYILAPVFMNKYGRKTLISGTHIIAGLAFLGIVLLPETYHLHFWLVGKFSISCSFMSIYMFAGELFPTDGRNKCIGFCETMSRFGGMLSPYLGQLATIFAMGPAIVLTVISITGGLLTLLLPETLNTKLPSTIAESACRKRLLGRSSSSDSSSL